MQRFPGWPFRKSNGSSCPSPTASSTSTSGDPTDDTRGLRDAHVEDAEPLATVGLDFGTYGTGIAYRLAGNQNVSYFNKWPGRDEHSYFKTLSAILYKDSQPIAWGWKAHNQYRELDDVQKLNGGYDYLERFKLKLASETDTGTSSPLPKGVTAVQVIADYLRMFKDHCLNKLADSHPGKHITAHDIQWCLTVPAIWKDDQKAAMRRAAHLAGLIPQENSSRLRIILEPEAAIHHAADAELLSLEHGNTIMLVDAGGGTVDLTAYTVEREHPRGRVRLAEAAPGLGGFCGSTFVDKNFEQWFREKLEPAVFDKWRQQHCGEYLKVMSKWEEKKCRQLRNVEIELPEELQKSISPEVVECLLDESGCDDTVSISKAQMEAFHEPQVQEIVELVKELANSCPGRAVNKVLLAGGFCKSSYLVASLRARLEGPQGVCPPGGIVVPRQPESFIVQGAALAGHAGPDLITSRVLRVAYGYDIDVPAPADLPKLMKKWCHERQCFTTLKFKPIAQRGDSVKVDDVVVDPDKVRASLPSANELVLTLYTAPHNEVVYVHEEGVKPVGDMQIPVTRGGKYEVELSFKFGREEIEIKATGGEGKARLSKSVPIRYSESSFGA